MCLILYTFFNLSFCYKKSISIYLGQLLGFLDDTKDKKMIPAGLQPFNNYTRYVIKRVKDLTDFKRYKTFSLLEA